MRSALLCLTLLLSPAAMVAAQQGQAAPPDPALVEPLARLLMAEDQRRYDSVLFADALQHREAQVRHTAVMGLARIGDRRAVPLLLPMLLDRDANVVADAFFGLGLLGDTLAITPIMSRLTLPDSLSPPAIGEAAGALARIGGARAGALLGDGIGGRAGLSAVRARSFRERAVAEAWRLGPAFAPVGVLISLANDRDASVRYGAIYSLQRLRPAAAGQVLLGAVGDRSQVIAEAAVRAMTRAYADSAGLPAGTVQAALVRALTAVSAGVRVNALLAVATWKDSTMVPRIAPLLTDASYNVQVQAATTLGAIGGSAAAKALDEAYGRKNATWALRRAALLAMAHADPQLFARRAGDWLKGTATSKAVDPREKVVALEGYGSIATADQAIFGGMLADPRPEVVATALTAWRRVAPAAPALLAAARGKLRDPSFIVRDAALGVLDTLFTVNDLDDLTAAWQLGTNANSLDDRLSIIRILGRLAETAPDLVTRISEPARGAAFVRPAEMLLRRQAQQSWPAFLGQRWGNPYPVETGRSLEDYRGIVRTYMLAAEMPRVAIAMDGRNPIEVELFAAESPLTVANFLQLVDRRYFDANTWHRVVPNFVVQTGDPTGSGSGGSDRPIRDEPNRRRYDESLLGMANAGPDTGTSQWFINIAPAPHLNGRYTAFGRVVNFGRIGTTLETAFSRITQGDYIRTIRRVAS